MPLIEYTEEEKNFEDALQQKANMVFMPNLPLSRQQIDKLNEQRILGKRFLTSIRELRSIMEPNAELWNGFLQAAANTLNVHTEDNFLILYRYHSALKAAMADNNTFNKFSIGSNIFFSGVYTAAGVSSVALGIYGIGAAAFGLAMGPLGALALSVGFIVLGLIVAGIFGYKLYKNIRAANDSQLQEITAFVESLDPNPHQVRNEEPFNAQNNVNQNTHEFPVILSNSVDQLEPVYTPTQYQPF